MKKIVRIKGVKKEALHTLRQKPVNTSAVQTAALAYGDGDTCVPTNQVQTHAHLKRSFEDIMKAQVSVIKASATLNIQAFKIKKSVSISFRMTQVHKMAKDHMMMIKDYDWMMISKKLKVTYIPAKLKSKVHCFRFKEQINEIKRLRAIQKINLKMKILSLVNISGVYLP
ncbi:hypothetical protein Tco_0326563 [Tanacetum coccineum]